MVDLNSGNGVWIGTDRVTGEIVLSAGEQFRIGSATFECVVIGAAAPVAPAPPPPAETTKLTFEIRLVEGGEAEPAGRTFIIDRPSVIGRGDDCEIKLAERDISRRHARVELTPYGVRLTDLDSTGGTGWVPTKWNRSSCGLATGSASAAG